jgi:hypothetical protein
LRGLGIETHLPLNDQLIETNILDLFFIQVNNNH